jgi:hypothetical protein
MGLEMETRGEYQYRWELVQWARWRQGTLERHQNGADGS